jgi:hypothetical protein
MPRITKTDIIHEAVEIKNFIEKNKKLPKYCTIQGNQYSVYTTAYLISRTISNLKADTFNVKPIGKSNQGFSVKLNENCSKTTYLDMIGRFNDYCSKNNRVPSYVVTIRNKADFTTFLYGISKIIVYYKENKVLPNSCLFTSSYIDVNKKEATKTKNNQSTSTSSNADTTIYTSSPHYLNTGCNNLGQCTSYYCGVHSVHQVLRKFGITKYNEAKLAGWAGTTTSGTNHQGILTAIAKASNGKLQAKWINFSSLGKDTNSRFKALGKLISQKDTDCIIHNLYRLKYGHYETIHKIDHTNKTVYVLNSLGDKCGTTSYCGYIEKRTYNEYAKYIANTPANQPSICLITKK